jgi:hypothetical protein
MQGYGSKRSQLTRNFIHRNSFAARNDRLLTGFCLHLGTPSCLVCSQSTLWPPSTIGCIRRFRPPRKRLYCVRSSLSCGRGQRSLPVLCQLIVPGRHPVQVQTKSPAALSTARHQARTSDSHVISNAHLAIIPQHRVSKTPQHRNNPVLEILAIAATDQSLVNCDQNDPEGVKGPSLPASQAPLPRRPLVAPAGDNLRWPHATSAPGALTGRTPRIPFAGDGSLVAIADQRARALHLRAGSAPSRCSRSSPRHDGSAIGQARRQRPTFSTTLSGHVTFAPR